LILSLALIISLPCFSEIKILFSPKGGIAEEKNQENLLEFIDEEEIIKVYQERLDYLWEFNEPFNYMEKHYCRYSYNSNNVVCKTARSLSYQINTPKE